MLFKTDRFGMFIHFGIYGRKMCLAEVGVQNSLLYACRLRELGTPVELHVYPDGGHGVGLAIDEKPSSRHNGDWITRFVNWLIYNGFTEDGVL